ncbi:hypothetical protein IC229_33605 [Spirosoma sp. BT702]|uniref:Uncharacterized protein n=1 Tax=Spirosoma profusum TaxID=2771354 RepID=A0A927GAQ1_9BACT|nr:hypothetical protein [Spirosoma profusum]MBD2705593.1 hypothetical protein [Spirosoma profusum]
MKPISTLNDNTLEAAYCILQAINDSEANNYTVQNLKRGLCALLDVDMEFNVALLTAQINEEHYHRRVKDQDSLFLMIRGFGNWNYLKGDGISKEQFIGSMSRMYDELKAKSKILTP